MRLSSSRRAIPCLTSQQLTLGVPKGELYKDTVFFDKMSKPEPFLATIKEEDADENAEKRGVDVSNN